MITVADLKDQTCVQDRRTSLYCPSCGAHYSANRADYFLYPSTREFTCPDCNNEPMILANSRCGWESVGYVAKLYGKVNVVGGEGATPEDALAACAEVYFPERGPLTYRPEDMTVFQNGVCVGVLMHPRV